MTRIVGVVLAGGRASRFGSEKAVALLRGRTLLERVAAIVEPGCAAMAVNAPPDSGAAALALSLGFETAADSPDDAAGPLAGIKAALLWADARKADLVQVAPCDTPMLPADLFARLNDGIGAAEAAVAESADGLHPLCGVWRPSAHRALAAMTAGRRHPAVRDALDAIGARRLMFHDPAAFANINTPADLAAAEARL